MKATEFLQATKVKNKSHKGKLLIFRNYNHEKYSPKFAKKKTSFQKFVILLLLLWIICFAWLLTYLLQRTNTANSALRKNALR